MDGNFTDEILRFPKVQNCRVLSHQGCFLEHCNLSWDPLMILQVSLRCIIFQNVISVKVCGCGLFFVFFKKQEPFLNL